MVFLLRTWTPPACSRKPTPRKVAARANRARAVAANESDGHVTIVDVDRDLVISLYQAKPISGGVLRATSGGMASLSGNG